MAPLHHDESPWRLKWRVYPVTTISIALCVAVFAYTHGGELLGWGRTSELQRRLGAITSQVWVHDDGREVRVVEPEFYGPLDLWKGQWWRIPVCSFHHGDLIHILCNLSAVWFISPWLERRFGTLWMSLFVASAAAISLLPEFLAGHDAIGYSGVICAIFGALWALRSGDPELQKDLTDSTIQGAIGFLVLGVVLTTLGIVSFANLAHFVGLGYGFLVGWVATVRPSRRELAVVGLIAAHSLVIPAWLLACHPFWIGRYHWFVADRQTNPAIKENQLQQAVAWDARLPGAWRGLTELQFRTGRPDAAWQTVLRGMRANPSSAALQEQAREVWWRWAVLQPQGPEQLAAIFGDQAPVIRELLKQPPRNVRITRIAPPGNERLSEMDLQRFRLDQGIDLSFPELTRPQRGGKLPPVDPDAFDSALEGRTM
jgi:rhomboid protease GluP